jgi:hypothetical protein
MPTERYYNPNTNKYEKREVKTETRINPPKKWNPDEKAETTEKKAGSEKSAIEAERAHAQVETLTSMPVQRPDESLGDFSKRMAEWRRKQREKKQ